jgi:hypothetical protein
MARAARKPKDDDTGVIKEKDFAQAVRLYRTDINKAVSDAATSMKDASDAYKVIKKHCNIQPAAAKLAFKLDKMEDAKRDDFLRCFTGLLKELNIAINPTDMVDMMQTDDGYARPKPHLGLVTLSDGDETDFMDAAEDLGDDETSADEAGQED